MCGILWRLFNLWIHWTETYAPSFAEWIHSSKSNEDVAAPKNLIHPIYYEEQEEKGTTKQKQMIVVKHLFAIVSVCARVCARVCLRARESDESVNVNVFVCKSVRD